MQPYTDNTLKPTLVYALTPDGRKLYYTGMSGQDYLSEDRSKAFRGYSYSGGLHKVEVFNKLGLQGYTFHTEDA